MIFDKIIYINLDRRPDRNLNVIEQIKKLGLTEITERFSAIDGTKIDMNNVDTNIITQDGINFAKKSDIIYTHLTVGAIGCAMSHRAIYQKIIDENINSCLILEDDITIDNKFNEKIKIIENYIKQNRLDYDLFFLGFHHTAKYDNTNKYKIVYGLFGYIVTNKGAKKLLNLFPLTYQIDTEISRNTDKINIYGVNVSNKIILSDESQYSYKFGTDIQIKNKENNGERKINLYVKGYLCLVIFVILCIIIIIFIKMI
jgi:GR25 family glycosyltransferase involved in LPS biosynthesis